MWNKPKNEQVSVDIKTGQKNKIHEKSWICNTTDKLPKVVFDLAKTPIKPIDPY